MPTPAAGGLEPLRGPPAGVAPGRLPASRARPLPAAGRLGPGAGGENPGARARRRCSPKRIGACCCRRRCRYYDYHPVGDSAGACGQGCLGAGPHGSCWSSPGAAVRLLELRPRNTQGSVKDCGPAGKDRGAAGVRTAGCAGSWPGVASCSPSNRVGKSSIMEEEKISCIIPNFLNTKNITDLSLDDRITGDIYNIFHKLYVYFNDHELSFFFLA